MRIRKCASRLLGSSYSSAPPVPAPGFELPLPQAAPPPPPPLPYPGGPESHGGGVCFPAATASGEPCELSRSPWDLIGELDLSDPQEEDLVEKYFVHVDRRASWLFPTTGPPAVKPEGLAAADESSAKPQQQKVTKRVVKKPSAKKKDVEKEGEESELSKRVKAKKEEVQSESAAAADGIGEAQVWTCKKNDGKRWHCQRRVSRPNSLCDYHFEQKRSYYNPLGESPSDAAPAPAADTPSAPAPHKPSASTKPSTSSKARKKKVADAGEGFYYYAGFGPFRTKRHCRSSNTQESTPAEEEEERSPEDGDAPIPRQEDRSPEGDAAPPKSHCDDDKNDRHQPRATVLVVSSSSDNDLDDIAGIAGGDEESSDDARVVCNGNGGLRAADMNGDAKKKSQLVRKRWRKPVKARSLKSLM